MSRTYRRGDGMNPKKERPWKERRPAVRAPKVSGGGAHQGDERRASRNADREAARKGLEDYLMEDE